MKQKLTWFFKSFIWLALLLIVLDFITKKLAEGAASTLGHFPGQPIIPNFLYLYYTRNTGAAWSIFEDYPWALAILSFVAGSAMIGYVIWKYKKLNAWTKAALMLMIAGTWGNFIDRAFYYPDGVIDFISMHFGSYVFPTYNVADSCLTVGIAILLVLTFVEDFTAKKTPKDKQAQ